MENPEFLKLLEKMKEIHSKKNEDYASVGFFENFDRQATLIGWFRNDTDKAFASCIGIKLARLGTLLDSGRVPNNESIEDTFLDLCTYAALWASYHSTMKNDPKSFQESDLINEIVEITVPKDSKECNRCGQRINGMKCLAKRQDGQNLYFHNYLCN